MEGQAMKITWKERNDLMWSHSIEDLAKPYKIAEHSLIVICTDMNIPLVERGGSYHGERRDKTTKRSLPASVGKKVKVILHPDSDDIKEPFVPVRELKGYRLKLKMS